MRQTEYFQPSYQVWAHYESYQTVCNVHSETVTRQCAEKVVRSELCPCASSVDSIVDAVVEKYLRQLGSGNSGKGMRVSQGAIVAAGSSDLSLCFLVGRR